VSEGAKTMTHDEWVAEAHRLFGDNPADWHFVCPICGNEASGHDFKAAGAHPNAMYQECIGRYTKGRSAMNDTGDGPCDYVGFGLIRLSPVHVTMAGGSIVHAFAFGSLPTEDASRKTGEA